jgi:arginine decarboxylase
MSCLHGEKGEFLNCGIVFGELFDNDEKIGSIVCEITNKDKQVNIKDRLYNTIMDLHLNTYSNYDIKNFKYIINEYVPDKKYGTCLVALCFYNFL